MSLRLACFLGVVALGGCGDPTEPTGPVRRGLYVLASIDQQPPPLVFERLDFGDTLSIFRAFDYDSIRIVDDTLFERRYSSSGYQQQPGQAPIHLGSGGSHSSGRILPRDGEIVLLEVHEGFLVPPPESFAIRPEGLLRRILISRAQCVTIFSCTVISNRFADALYTRR